MKKNMLKGLFGLALVALLAGPAFAGNATNGNWTDPANHTDAEIAITDATGTVGPGISFGDLKFSTGVQYRYAASSDGNTFGIGTWNSKGTKAYITNSDSSKLYISTIAIASSGAIKSFVSSGTPASADWSEVGK